MSRFPLHAPSQHPITHLLPGIRDDRFVVTAQQRTVSTTMTGPAIGTGRKADPIMKSGTQVRPTNPS